MKFNKNRSEIGIRFEELPEKLLLKNGLVIDPLQNINKVSDILIETGVIKKMADSISESSSMKVIDLKGKVVAPGFFDMHVHLREPGQEGKETIETGCLAAANGGFTAVASMPNTSPVVDSQEIIQYIKDRAKNLLVDVYPVASISKGGEGKELSEILELIEAGAVGISDDGSPVMNSELMRRALEYCTMVDIPIICHEEDLNMTEGTHMHEGYYSTLLGMKGYPSVAESSMVQRDILLTEYTGGKIHIAHISDKDSIELVRQAKRKGIKVTAEATPHHFTLTDKDVTSFDTNTKMNPPLRTEEDRLAVIEGLKDGTIDAIATDHAPHSIEEKEMEYIYAPNGVIGLETALGLSVTQLLKSNVVSLEQLVKIMAVNPRKILNIPVPEIKAGVSPNLSIFDPDKEWKVDVSKFKSKSINTPFADWKLTGRPFMVINDGKYLKSEL